MVASRWTIGQAGELVEDFLAREHADVALFAVVGFFGLKDQSPGGVVIAVDQVFKRLPHCPALGYSLDEAKLLYRLLPVLLAGVWPQAGVDVGARPFHFGGLRAGSVLPCRRRQQAGVNQLPARHVAIRHLFQRGLQQLDLGEEGFGVEVEPVAVVIANRGILQFVRQTVDDEPRLRGYAGNSVLPECFVDDDQAKIFADRRWRLEQKLVRRKHHVGFPGQRLLSLVVADVIERAVDGFLAAPGFAAGGLLDDGADVYCGFDRLGVQAHLFVNGAELDGVAALPNGCSYAVGHLDARLGSEFVCSDEIENAVRQSLELGPTNEPGDHSADRARLADACRDLDGLMGRVVAILGFYVSVDLVPFQ